MRKITAQELVRSISGLPKNHGYAYIEPSTSTRIEIGNITNPAGPIRIKRFNPSKGQGATTVKPVSISAGMIRRYANAFREGVPINIDRVLGASYNTRSALESLLAHTPQFYYCYPGRIDSAESSTNVEEGHKLLIWRPEQPHALGVLTEFSVENMTISEIPSVEAVYDAVTVPAEVQKDAPKEVARRHAGIQIALAEIGKKLGFRTWVAQNDHAIIYKGKRLGQLDGVVQRLEEEQVITAHMAAVTAALFVDVIWFRNSRFMPAVIEIEHTTGVTTGLSRMKTLQDNLPPIPRRWIVAAPDEDRDRVVREANKEQFQSLQTWFLPYSSVDELYSLCQRRNLRGTTDEFLDSYMEPCLGDRVVRYG